VRRTLLIAVGVIVALGAVAGLLAFLSARDDATIGSDEPGVEAPRETARTLARGNVVLDYGDPADAERLRALAIDFGASADPALEDAGAAVILDRRAGVRGVVARAYRRRLEVGRADDPALREFVEFWLGRGAGDTS
jgi:hypothetical protein